MSPTVPTPSRSVRAADSDPNHNISISDLKSLADFRRSLRRFLAFSEEACAQHGITMQWYQALLAIKAYDNEKQISIGQLADELMIKNHSATELVSRLENARLVSRKTDKTDLRRSLIVITNLGNRKIDKLAAIHLNRIRNEKIAFLNLFNFKY